MKNMHTANQSAFFNTCQYFIDVMIPMENVGQFPLEENGDIMNYDQILSVILRQSAVILIKQDAQDNQFVLNEGENYMMRDGGYWGLGGEGRKADKAGGGQSLC